jgi:hypothetical protein
VVLHTTSLGVGHDKDRFESAESPLTFLPIPDLASAPLGSTQDADAPPYVDVGPLPNEYIDYEDGLEVWRRRVACIYCSS